MVATAEHFVVLDKYIDAILSGSKKPIKDVAKEVEFTEQQIRTIVKKDTSQEHISNKLEKVLEGSNLSKIELINELNKLAFSNISDIVAQVDDKGIVYHNWSTLDESITAAVSEVSTTENKYGTNVKVKLHPKLAALSELVKIYQMIKPADNTPEVTVNVGERLFDGYVSKIEENVRKNYSRDAEPSPPDSE